MAVGNYEGRISPLPMRKLNFKCSVAAAWTMLTSVFAMNWVDFSSCSYCLLRYRRLVLNGGRGKDWREDSFLAHVRLVSDGYITGFLNGKIAFK